MNTFTASLTLAVAVTDVATGFEVARWIASPAQTTGQALPIFRKEFFLAGPLGNATLRVVGLGDYDALINGKRVTETGINQPWSQYEKTIYYRDFDVTALLVPGTNCVGVMLANSFWNNPDPPPGRYNKTGPQRTADEPFRLCAELILRGTDGTIQRIGSDATWRTTAGPVSFSHIFAGEDFDARRRLFGWDCAGFDDTAWWPARLLAPPVGLVEQQVWPGFKELERFEPVTVKEPAPGAFLYSFAQNCSAQLRIELAGGKSGDRVSFRCGEHKNDKDRLFGGYVVGCDVVTDGQPFRHQWMSYYLGMQYVEVTGAVPEGHANPDQLPSIKHLELVHVRTALPEIGSFHCSSELFNRTHQLIDWAMRANTSHVLTDCPHREKLGWLECAYLLAPSFEYRYDCREWFSKLARDIRDTQQPNGKVLTVAPSYPAGRFPGAFDYTVEWGAAAVMLPWYHYEWYGDPAILRDSFESMKRFTDFIGTEAKEGFAPMGGLGDWYDYGHGQPPGESRFTPTDLSATATWALCALTVSHAADVLGQPAEAAKYRELHAKIAANFQRRFRDPASRKLRHTGSPQCANAMALCADLVPVGDRAVLVGDIITDLQKRDWQQTPGDVGHVYFIRALAEAGRSDVLHRVYSRQDKGSYGGILSKGLTSLPETWDATMDGIQSLDHCMLGHVIEWFYGYVAGIRQPLDSAGWQRVLIAPNPGALTSAEATVQTPRGRVASRWCKDGPKFHLEAEIPQGVKAEALMPSGARRQLSNGLNILEEPCPLAVRQHGLLSTKEHTTMKRLLALLAITIPFAASAAVQEQAHYSLKDAGGIRDTAAPEVWKSPAAGGPDLSRRGSPKLMSRGPECRRHEYDSCIKFEEPDQCYNVGKSLVDGDSFVLEAWAYAIKGNDSGLHTVVANGHGGMGFILGQSGDEWVVLVGGVGFTTLAKVQPESWTHLAVVKSDGVASGWVNGKKTCGVPGLGGAIQNFSIGATAPGKESFKGWVAEVRYSTFQPGQFDPAADFLLDNQKLKASQAAETAERAKLVESLLAAPGVLEVSKNDNFSTLGAGHQ